MDGIYSQDYLAALAYERERAIAQLLLTREASRHRAAPRPGGPATRPTIWRRIRSSVPVYGR